MKKWIVLVAAVILQGLLGGVYAWSTFVPALSSRYGLSNAQCGMIFGLAIAVFTVAMVPAGRLLHVVGVRRLASFGACMFAAGYIVASLSGGRFPILLLGVGVIGGVGIGTAYVCPLTVCMQWFPRNKGLVTGLAVAGFGGGAVLLSFLADHLLHNAGWDVLRVFRFLGIGFGAVALCSAMLLSAPPADSAADVSRPPVDRIGPDIFSLPFLLLCVGMFAGTFAGLLTVGNLKPLILANGLPVEVATLGISVFAVGNAMGRVAWGQIHDRVASRTTILLSLSLLAVALLPLVFVLPASIMLLAIWCCGCGFGACFVVYPAAVVQRFGIERFPRLYPLCFLGYGLAGLIAPGLGGRIADATGSYAGAVILCVATLVVAIVAIGVASALGESVWSPEEGPVAECLES